MNGEVLRLQSEHARIAILPRLGGRLASFHALGREWLWRNTRLLDDDFQPLHDPDGARAAQSLGDWWNWGGDKSWPAPQGWDTDDQWHGPPDPVLDAGPYSATVDPAHLTCTLVSGDDARTGLRITRTITLSASEPALTIDTTLTNVSNRPRTWSCWTVTQIDVGSDSERSRPAVHVGYEAGAKPPVTLFSPVGRLDFEGPLQGAVAIPIQDAVGKLGFPGANGWIDYRTGGGSVLRQTFPVSAEQTYPDQGSRAALWMQYPLDEPIESLSGLTLESRLVELECLSPLTRLEPGQSVSLDVQWLAHRQ